MKISNTPDTPAPGTRRAAFGLLLTLALSTGAPAADWYLDKDQPQYSGWDTLADWNSAADGTGTAATALSASDTYYANGRLLRTPEVNTVVTFGGGKLVLQTSSDHIGIKTGGSGAAVIPSLLTTGGLVTNMSGGTQNLQIGAYENRSGSTAFNVAAGRTLSLATGTLAGAGQFRFYGGGTYKLALGGSEAYDGEIYIQSGTVDFESDFGTAGKLTLATGAKANLDQSVTFTALSIEGISYPVGNYSYAYLAAQHPAVFLGGTTAGFINVRAPANWYMSVNQPVGSSWNTLSQWKPNPDGTGTSPAVINSFDNYIVNVSGRNLRTPETDSIFGGGSVVVSGGAYLRLKAPSGKISTIPELVTSGTANIASGFTGITQTLVLGDWRVDTGTTTVTTGTGGTIDLQVNYLYGAGNVTIGSGSIIRPRVNHGGRFTGTLTVATGASLVLNDTFGIGGPLVVQSGGNVTLNAWTYVTGLTVAGVTKPLGTYTAASLGFAGTGTLVVSQPTADSPRMFGVNLAGAEFGGYAFWQTNPATWDYYQSKGLTLIRMPVKWERIQPALYGPVNFTQMDQCVALAAARGMKVIIDLHNYASYGGNTLGGAGLPIDAMVNVWEQIADHYKNEPAVYGYDLMNEPVGINMATWSSAAQRTVDAIRKKDASRYVIVEGLAYSKATTWVPTSGTGNITLDIRDPIGRLIYSAHSYWDYKDNPYASPPYYGSDGIYRSDDVPAPDIGVKHVKPFVEWLKTRPYAYGNVGEYCVPNNYYSAGWNEAMANFLQYLSDNNIGATYWAGGDNWTSSPTVCQPQPFPGTDKPQMAVLELFGN